VARGYFANLIDLTIHGVPVALYFRDIGIPGDVKMTRDFLSYPYLAIYAAAWLSVVAACVRRMAGGTVESSELSHVRRVTGGTTGSPGFAHPAQASEESAARSPSNAASATRRLSAAVLACPELPLLALFPLFLVVIAASNQEFNDYGLVRYITFRIIVPALPSLFFVVALAVSRARGPLRGAVLGFIALLGIVGNVQLLMDGSDGMVAREAEARQLGAEAFGHLLVFKHGTEPRIASERIEALPIELREAAWRGVGYSYANLYGTKRSSEPASLLTTALLRLDPTYRYAWLEGARLAVGPGLRQVAPLPPSPRSQELLDAIRGAE
jgi:hypothetical protein